MQKVGNEASDDRTDNRSDDGTEKHVAAILDRQGFSLKPLPFFLGFLIGTALTLFFLFLSGR